MLLKSHSFSCEQKWYISYMFEWHTTFLDFNVILIDDIQKSFIESWVLFSLNLKKNEVMHVVNYILMFIAEIDSAPVSNFNGN